MLAYSINKEKSMQALGLYSRQNNEVLLNIIKNEIKGSGIVRALEELGQSIGDAESSSLSTKDVKPLKLTEEDQEVINTLYTKLSSAIAGKDKLSGKDQLNDTELARCNQVLEKCKKVKNAIERFIPPKTKKEEEVKGSEEVSGSTTEAPEKLWLREQAKESMRKSSPNAYHENISSDALKLLQQSLQPGQYVIIDDPVMAAKFEKKGSPHVYFKIHIKDQKNVIRPISIRYGENGWSSLMLRAWYSMESLKEVLG